MSYFQTLKQVERPQEITRANQIIVETLGITDLFHRQYHYSF